MRSFPHFFQPNYKAAFEYAGDWTECDTGSINLGWRVKINGCTQKYTCTGEATRSVGTESISVTVISISSTLINI